MSLAKNYKDSISQINLGNLTAVSWAAPMPEPTPQLFNNSVDSFESASNERTQSWLASNASGPSPSGDVSPMESNSYGNSSSDELSVAKLD